jgi:4-amino-4-deoxy-L-arabinose transferase-like glycosyltransferase
MSDKAIMLPVFEGITYKALGFPAFLYMLCSWNIATMCILIVSTYCIGKHYFNEKTGLLATFLVGLNWHVIWFGQRLLGDIGMIAFEFASIAFFLKYTKSRNGAYLLASGLGGALAIWTREAALYLYPPLLLMLIILHRPKIRDLIPLSLGFIAGFAPFMIISNLKYGDPLHPFLERFAEVGIQRATTTGITFNANFILGLPFSIGTIVLMFFMIGLYVLLKKRQLLLPVWGAYSLAPYLFVFTKPYWDQYIVHYTPIFLIIAAVGLKQITEWGISRYGDKAVIIAALTCLSTNLYTSPAIYSFSKGRFVMPIFLHQRLAFVGANKYPDIAQLIGLYQNRAQEIFPIMLFSGNAGVNPLYSLILLGTIALGTFVCAYTLIIRE